jgi:hypothetical protein
MNKSYAKKVNEAKAVFQKWIRHRDKELPCISCQITYAKEWNAGHYKKAELYSGVIFNEHNVNKQCSQCNKYLQGNEEAYRKGLENKIGTKEILKLEELATQTRITKYSNQELKEIIDKYAITYT